MEERNITVIEAIEKVIGDLERIIVPVMYGDQITRPICGAVAQLRACVEAMKRSEEKPAEEGKTDV